ncbi:FAD dependent oxidoreductase-domain-containing protein [Truncatella angustata]|uniref:FAD dependent oxidoreductase-domain-containing protein n=1 Tax=Truncatella angustata TaxID=152316 RepID=A0A9P8UPV1_9PEZI|nr:FAD dependent oxidoreductase-domain-containing protein [Truncatella angustata]KAH6656037.1 FAD dependent oxidoreductase-domain-containing protein [Truncatella angustata]KAH8198387.1 hypothetical protein TruAng_007422 [Truncatella angustata]
MGAIFSLLRDTLDMVGLVLVSIGESNAIFVDALQRIRSPRLPATNPTKAFWQEKPPFPDLVNVQSKQLPALADIVIIGSGLSGASIAHTILHESYAMGVPRRVTILEGRTVCSGATGRNGGHIKASPHIEYAKLKKRFGAESAKKMVSFMMMHLPLLLDLIKREGHEISEAREVLAVDAFMEPNMLLKAREMIEVLRADLPDLAERITVLDAELAQKDYGFSDHCVGAISYPAGAMWPYRLVTSIYNSLLSTFPGEFSIETGTMVENIQPTRSTETPFMLVTSRGEILAAHVVHASDAFATNLVPGLKEKLFPIRGHMSAQRPGKAFPRHHGDISWAIVGKSDYEYVTQRPGLPNMEDGIGGEIMIGGGTVRADDGILGEVGQWDDNKTVYAIGAYLGGILPLAFNQHWWGDDAEGSRVKGLWTGCMGFTADMLPLVGKLSPSLTGRPVLATKTGSNSTCVEKNMPEPAEWISAGFNGSGMVLSWLSGVATGLMIVGREHVESKGEPGRPQGAMADWFPKEFACSATRVSQQSVYKLSKLA